ncbi:unnamed protein product [Arabis nemorensis]|uniref:Uncharacterized protein n=1 Tax=Arabis nemorensis TaxID=586526 RepID=A0A565AV82_9BRAS|nr:unnamed protein product [Arabis nemorensis]
MESVSAVNQTLPISSDETEKFTVYSAAVHKVVVMVNAGIIGLVQLMNKQNSSLLEINKTEFLCFYIFVFFYVVLRVREAVDTRLRPGLVPKLVGHTSHMFGALAALVLVSVFCTTFAFVLLLLWFLWLSLVAYDTFNAIKLFYSESGAGLPQSSPV